MSVVYTIGYEGTDIERFVETLKVVGIKVLADVRAVTLSRKKGFSKNLLRARLEGEGIAYLHYGALGDPKPGREAARAGHYQEFKKIYEVHLRDTEAQLALANLVTVVRNAPSCLLCFERDPRVCHRTIVAEKLSANGVEIFELFGDDPARYVSHASKLPRHHLGQSATAA